MILYLSDNSETNDLSSDLMTSHDNYPNVNKKNSL